MNIIDRKSLKSSTNDAGRKVEGTHSEYGVPLTGGRGKSLVGRGIPIPRRKP